MTLNEYQKKAMSFRLPSADADYAILNLGGEVGELMGLLAKALRDGEKPDFLSSLRRELGDILWHVAAVAKDFDFSLEDIAVGNVDKLASRKERGALQGSGDFR